MGVGGVLLQGEGDCCLSGSPHPTRRFEGALGSWGPHSRPEWPFRVPLPRHKGLLEASSQHPLENDQ